MEFNKEIFQLLFVWVIAYSIVKPFEVILNYMIYKLYGIKTVFQQFSATSPIIVVFSEFTFMLISFMKTMYFYKKIYNKPTYFPRKGNWEDYRDFIIMYIITTIILDVLWTIFVNYTTFYYKPLSFLKNFSHDITFTSLSVPIVYGVILVFVTDIVLNYIPDFEALGSLVASLFLLSLASFH